MALLLKFAFLISILKSDYGDCSCNVSEFHVQQNFDIEKVMVLDIIFFPFFKNTSYEKICLASSYLNGYHHTGS